MVETHAITQRRCRQGQSNAFEARSARTWKPATRPTSSTWCATTLVSKFNEHELNDQSYRIYTTLDPDLQRAAAQSVEAGIKLVDDQITKMRTRKVKIGKNKFETKVLPGPQAQVALVALGSAHGRSLALVGGRNLRVELS